MNPLDAWVMSEVSQLTHRSEILDMSVLHLLRNELLKGGVVVGAFWWLWFGVESKVKHAREVLLANLLASLVAVATTRIAAVTFPFRLRPLHDPSLDYQLPFGGSPEALGGWSAFPSDHATLYFALAMGLLFISRPIGYAMLGYVTLFITAPRVYAGLHYPTDILAGAIIGIACAAVANHYRCKQAVSGLALRWLDTHPASFYSALFLLTFQAASLFEGARGIAVFLYRASKLL